MRMQRWQVVSSLLAGAAVGSLSGSGLADSLGRKTTLLLDAAPLLAGALLSATASTLTALILGRVLAGVGIGLASALVPLYISEVGPIATPRVQQCSGGGLAGSGQTCPPPELHRMRCTACARSRAVPISPGRAMHGRARPAVP